MNVALQALTQNADPKLVAAQLALFKAGQILQALVVGQSGSGLTQLKIGDLLIEAQLPQPAQPGTMLQLQVKTGGSAPQLALLSQQAPAARPEVARIPLPAQVTNVVLPEVEPPVPIAGQAQQAVVRPQAQPTAPVQIQPQQVTTGPQVAATQMRAPVVASEVVQQQLEIMQREQVVTPPASQIESGPSAVVTPRGDGQQAVAEAPVRLPAQPQQTVLPQGPQPPPSAVVEPQVLTVALAPVAPQTVPIPSGPPGPPATAAVPQPQVIAAAAQPSPVAEQLSVPTAAPQPVVQPAPVADAAEPVAVSPLLVAQAAPKVPQTLADMPRATPVPVQSAPVASALPPRTPEQAVAQMVPEAMAKQNSVAPLLQSLAAVVAQPALLPEPIIRAALQVLAQRIVVPDSKVQAGDIEKAVARSGVYLEAALANAAPVPGDAKATLLNLRAVLERFLGGAPPANPPPQRETPPLRELPPRAMAMEPLPVPADPRDAARVLHSQTDAAISRVKLGQLAGLPDAPNTPRSAQPESRMELPFLIGHELVMAQLQIAQDGRREPTTRKRGWTMRFAMNFSQTGEVGAEIGLLGKSVNVSLWAAETETAEALNAALPELAQALEALGLDPGGVRIRSSVPEQPKIASGHFVDAMT